MNRVAVAVAVQREKERKIGRAEHPCREERSGAQEHTVKTSGKRGKRGEEKRKPRRVLRTTRASGGGSGRARGRDYDLHVAASVIAGRRNVVGKAGSVASTREHG